MAFWFIDCETLGTPEDSVILSIGLLRCVGTETFEELIENGWYWEIDAKEQIKYGRKVYKDTLDWWNSQNDDAKRVLKQPNKISLKTFAEEMTIAMSKFIKKEDFIWSRGMIDFKWTTHLYDVTLKNSGISYTDPVWYSSHRDVRTALHMGCGDPYLEVDTPGFIAHNALHDAAKDACRLMKCFN